ncbi:MAG: metal ABC transporter substrate-binding protein [Desulfobulbaceae bacterium]|jgi:zinc transport system substrate-binding protein|nr:metal ABC transporter substrate-binding protein [Desulfobulbaceae bacterium]
MTLKKSFCPVSGPGTPVLKTVITGILTTVWIVNVLVFQAAAGEQRLQVVASIFPAYDFARAIGGDRVELTQLLPPGVEAHGFSPTPRDIIRINQAAVLLYTGSVMEPRVHKLLRSIDSGVRVVDLSSGLLTGGDQHEHNGHNGVDPHFWLDPLQAKIMVARIGQAFSRADPAHAEGYSARAEAYLEKLTNLDIAIRTGLAGCARRTIISGGHFAFGHFINRYDLKAVSAYPGFSADGKPSPRSIVTLIETMQKTGGTAVYHEELINPKVARIIAEETGCTLLLLHGVHNVSKDEMESATYLSLMEDNLQRLQQGLVCP